MAATRGDATGSLRNLTCPMCLGIFTEATILTSCGHTFCRNCLKTYDLSHQDRNYMICPLCQKNTNLSANRVDGLLANVTVNKFVDDYRAKNGGANATTARIRPKCTSCKPKPHAVSFCRTCNDHLCDECRYCHEHLSVFEGHDIVSMQDAIKKCSFHRLEKKDVFCEDCKIYICLKCLPDGHQYHKIQNRATFGEELQLEVDNLVKRCVTKEPELQKNIQNVAVQQNEVTIAMQRLLNDVNNAYRIKSRRLKEYHQILKTQIHTLEKSYGDALNGVKFNDLQKIEGIRSSIARIAQIDKDTLGNLETEYLSVHKFMCKDLDYLLKEGNGCTSAEVIKNKAQRNKFKPSGKTRITLGSISGFTDTTPGLR
ncbi:transcription intermediary factor 1-beta-like [Lytechinus variegatus]|uniref:transcription intermediary factor 1-beta-like n=1 Tax=Lytechinus variegatus TaxID=7654 RepID=UPI001BB103A0|nr:transcription intermediary factor 1-beta-like [Lytechinus variegatus]